MRICAGITVFLVCSRTIPSGDGLVDVHSATLWLFFFFFFFVSIAVVIT